MSTIAEMAEHLRAMGESPSSIKYLILRDYAPAEPATPVPYTAPATETGD